MKITDKYNNTYTIKINEDYDLLKHAELIKQDSENTLPVSLIKKEIETLLRKNNLYNIFLYKNNELVAFIYSFTITSTVMKVRYFWFNNAKYALLLLLLVINLNKKLTTIYTGYIYNSSKWYRFKELITNTKSEETLISRFNINKNNRNSVTKLLYKFGINTTQLK